MFDENLVVASAVSAFNNAAVVGPAFLWNAVLASPLFVAIYFFARHGMDKMGIRPYVTMARATFWTVVITALWVVLMGGNYSVLRDGVSLVPFVTAAVLFASCIFVGINTRAIKLPIWYGSANASVRRRWIVNLAVFAICMVPVGLSDTLNWWGPILQIGAVVCGFVVGRYGHRQMRAVPCAIAVMLATTIAILMQPELFRFGQLGNLTPMHLVWVLGVGILAAAAMALDITNSRGRIHQSAYTKLKWLTRFVTVLCMVLFVLTEAVPVFIAAVISAFVQFSMAVWHATAVREGLGARAMAWLMIAFGVLTGMVTVTAIGILLIASNESGRGGAGFLL